jgi:hypothetical protein
MPKITVQAYDLQSYNPATGSFSVLLMSSTPVPARTFEIKTVADCESALAGCADEAAETGKPYMLKVNFVRKSGRKPAGFDQAAQNNRLRTLVNTAAAPVSSH